MALDLGDERDCPDCECCCEPGCWNELKGDGVEAGDGGLRPPERRLEEVRTAEKVEVRGDEVEMPGPGLLDWGGLREGAAAVDEDERLLVASGVNPRRRPDWGPGEPQTDC